MNNYTHKLTNRLGVLIGLYVALFAIYTSLPADLYALRQIISPVMLVLMAVTVIVAVRSLFPTHRA